MVSDIYVHLCNYVITVSQVLQWRIYKFSEGVSDSSLATSRRPKKKKRSQEKCHKLLNAVMVISKAKLKYEVSPVESPMYNTLCITRGEFIPTIN